MPDVTQQRPLSGRLSPAVAAVGDRFARLPAAKRRTQKALRALATWPGPRYLFPLQLDCDTQIRIHSPFGRLAPAIELIVGSFARHAPQDSCLVLKEHPLAREFDCRSCAAFMAVDTQRPEAGGKSEGAGDAAHPNE